MNIIIYCVSKTRMNWMEIFPFHAKAPVTAIASGTYHNAVVTVEGQVYCWGSSKEGQCGTGCLDIVRTPTVVPVEISTGFCQHGIPNPASPVCIKSVACGASHTLALSYGEWCNASYCFKRKNEQFFLPFKIPSWSENEFCKNIKYTFNFASGRTLYFCPAL